MSVAPFGSWRSPITSELVAADSITLIDVLLDGSDIYWIESRPDEGGRYVVVRYAEGCSAQDVTPPPFNARTKVHEYGGGAVLAYRGSIFFPISMTRSCTGRATKGYRVLSVKLLSADTPMPFSMPRGIDSYVYAKTTVELTAP